MASPSRSCYEAVSQRCEPNLNFALNTLGREQPQRRVLRTGGKQAQIGGDTGLLSPVTGQGLVTIHTDDEMPPAWEVLREANARTVTMGRLLLPHLRLAAVHVGLPVPNDGGAVVLAMLHHRVHARGFQVIHHGPICTGRVVDDQEFRLALRPVDDDYSRHEIKPQPLREPQHPAAKVLHVPGLEHRGKPFVQHLSQHLPAFMQ